MAEPDAILRVTVEAPVYTRDGQKIGKVAEVRGGALKVQTGLLQRDFWLPADSVSSAVSGDRVMLAHDKAELPQYKVSEPTRAA